jgi:hypothetical protein
MTFLKSFLRRLMVLSNARKIQKSLSPQRRGEVRTDGLRLTQASFHLEIAWCARDVHPWDCGCEASERESIFTEQCFADSDAALSRLFCELPHLDVIDFIVFYPISSERILAGTVDRTARSPTMKGLSPRTRLWYRGISAGIVAAFAFALVASTIARSQTPAVNQASESSSTSTDLFVMIGSDFDRPGFSRGRTITSASGTPTDS